MQNKNDWAITGGVKEKTPVQEKARKMGKKKKGIRVFRILFCSSTLLFS